MPTHGEHQPHHEQQQSQERLDGSGEVQNNLERIQHEAKAAEHDPLQHSVEALKARADREAKSTHEYDKHDVDATPSHSFMLHRELKNDAYRQTLLKTRRHLSAPERALSKLIHQPVIESASETAANTIGRASGLFTGSLFALLGSAFLLYMTKRYGFTYNYGVFVLCFVAGFALGLLVELMWRVAQKKQ